MTKKSNKRKLRIQKRRDVIKKRRNDFKKKNKIEEEIIRAFHEVYDKVESEPISEKIKFALSQPNLSEIEKKILLDPKLKDEMKLLYIIENDRQQLIKEINEELGPDFEFERMKFLGRGIMESEVESEVEKAIKELKMETKDFRPRISILNDCKTAIDEIEKLCGMYDIEELAQLAQFKDEDVKKILIKRTKKEKREYPFIQKLIKLL